MATAISLNPDCLHALDLSPVAIVMEHLQAEGAIATQDPKIRFEIDYPREPDDPRELSEIPEIRLWFLCLDAQYPWLPFVLDWEAGELARYTAMLVPHQFSPHEGIRYNPEALELFAMGKVFVLWNWMQEQGVENCTKLKFMTQMLGYELDDEFFSLLTGSSSGS